MTLPTVVLRLGLALAGLTSLACGLLPAKFPPQFVHSNHLAAGPSWMMATPSREPESAGQEAIGSAMGLHVQYERRLTQYLYVQMPLEMVSRASVRIGVANAPVNFSSLYFTPAIELRYPSNWWIQWCLSGGAGVARFNTASRSDAQWAPFANLGLAAQIGAHWGIRADLRGRHVTPQFLGSTSYNPASFSVVPVFIF